MVDLLRHLFLPHQTNNHRARALHGDALALYALGFAIFYLATSLVHKIDPNVLGYATDIHVDQLLSATNVKRQAAGLGTLTLNEELSRAAAAKAADMFAKGYWAHNSPDGKSPWDFIVANGYSYTIAGENLAKNFNDSTGVVNAWMNSPSHRDNILKPGYRDIGFAVVNGVLNGEETTLVVQMFGNRAGQIAQAPKQPVIQQVQAKAPVAPVVVSQEASATNAPTSQSPFAIAGFTDVFKKPLVDLAALSRGLSFIFVGFMLGVLVLDAWFVARRRIVRVAGHNIAHFVFLGTLLLSMTTLARGTVL